MLTYTLDKQAGLSLYEQLYRRVKADILSGRLAAGEKLPSKRALAAHLEVSVITVKNAYEQLMAEGYLTGVEKKGYFVSAVLPSPAAVPAFPEQPPPPREPAWFLDLATNSIAAEDFPFTVWARLMRQTILEQGTGLLRSTPPTCGSSVPWRSLPSRSSWVPAPRCCTTCWCSCWAVIVSTAWRTPATARSPISTAPPARR